MPVSRRPTGRERVADALLAAPFSADAVRLSFYDANANVALVRVGRAGKLAVKFDLFFDIVK